MRHQQQGTAAPLSLEPRHEVETILIGAKQFSRYAVRIGDLLQVFGDSRFISRRVGRIQPDQVDQVLLRAFAERRIVVQGGEWAHQKETGSEPAHSKRS